MKHEIIRSDFADELSRRIFDWRLRLADGSKYVFPEILNYMDISSADKHSLINRVKKLRDEQIETYIYGAGLGCRFAVYSDYSRELLGIRNIKGIIDNYIKNERYGLPIMTFAEFAAKHREAMVFNSIGSIAGRETHRQCEEAGIEVVSLYEIDASWFQYFDLPAKLGFTGENEVFVQAGCLNGDTQKSYINWFGTNYQKQITFEPNAAQYSFCKNVFAGMHNIELVQAALSDHTGRARLETENITEPCESHISQDGNDEIQVVALDEYMNGGKVSFIALDIEGGEYNALLGAEQIIREQKPKLAICVYHKPEDILGLPALVKQFRPDYKLYLRHYNALDPSETVLYAF